jgi:hypothetical protein
LLGGVADGDVAGLQLVGNTPHQVDMEQPVLKCAAIDLDVIGQIEATLKRARRDALVEVLDVWFVLLLAGYREPVGFRRDGDLVGGKPATALLI